MKKTLLLLMLIHLFSNCNHQNQDDSLALILAGLSTSPSGGTASGTGNANILSTTPIDGQVLNSSTTTIVVNFSGPMNTTSAESSFMVSDSSIAITGAFAWSNSNRTLTFTPTSLTSWRVHTVTISSSAKTASGTSVDPYSFTFRIGPFFESAGKRWQQGDVSLTQSGKVNCTLSSGKWICPYDESQSYCNSFGMTLPTNTEFSNAYAGNASLIFNPGGFPDTYWSSTVGFDPITTHSICRIDDPGVPGTFIDCAGWTSNANRALIRCVL